MPKQIPYGTANYVELVEKNCYFVDKTPYIETLEQISNPIYLRPRKFGKSLWCRILECYYNINQKDEFDYLFGETYIGQNPTGKQNSYLILHLDFSTIDPTGTIVEIERHFNFVCNLKLGQMIDRAKSWLQDKIIFDSHLSATENLQRVLDAIPFSTLPQLYVIIDEYDSFANQLQRKSPGMWRSCERNTRRRR
jgi:hypothetical protein